MARYRGPRLRIVRRLGELSGLTRKSPTRTTAPGQHGANSKNARSGKQLNPYGVRLKEKQKIRFYYGLTERQLLRYVRQAKKLKGSTGEVLLELLEMRLDNIVFKLGMAPTIPAARQLINHGHIVLNNQKITIPSYQCQSKDVISVKGKKNSRTLIAHSVENSQHVNIPSHLTFNKESLVGVVNDKVAKDSIGLEVNKLLVVEYYSRKGC
uniref:Small ribosomal subunit protein uS4c n=2 Tax=Ignatiaceae TaxID=2682551 RepID=A0A1W6EGU7_9CHLO|nr:ribosomal protein S4 [Pseudocharacium americanum]YP_009367722.1 ribosomal protein S4 [Ignatius tetrasporus]ARK14613.1 ribosomal protein S4 [Pseudocharacium americanum]ARK14702.1 ribosomal protein S4 [Ignatius tetrasporus]